MKWMQAALLLVLAIGGATAAAEYDDEGKKIFKTLMGNHAPAFVRVNWVMATSFMGQEQNTESSTTGVIVDPTGLVLVPRIVVEPTMPNQKLTPEQRASFKMSARDFQIHFPGEDKPLAAEALTTDADQGVAWLKIKDVGDRKFPFVDTTRAETASPGQSYYVIERLEERYGEKPILSWGIIQGEIDVPQKAHIVTGALGLAFSAKGKVLGYVSANFEGMGNDSFSMTGGMRMLMTPAKRLHSANLRAASLLDEPVAP